MKYFSEHARIGREYSSGFIMSAYVNDRRFPMRARIFNLLFLCMSAHQLDYFKQVDMATFQSLLGFFHYLSYVHFS